MNNEDQMTKLYAQLEFHKLYPNATDLGNGIYYAQQPSGKYAICNTNTGQIHTELDFDTAKRTLNTW